MICQASVFSAIQAGNVFAYVPDISSAKGTSSDMVQLLNLRPKIDFELMKARKLSKIMPEVKFALGMSISITPTRPGVRVLSGLSLNVQTGMYIALVVASGSNKSAA